MFTLLSIEVAQARRITRSGAKRAHKLNAAMGFSGAAAKVMAQHGCCGFYLAVDQPGHLLAGEGFELLPGPRRLRITESFRAKMFKHLR